MKSLASSFFMLGKMKTTEAKAKELRPYVERFMTRGKNPDLADLRYLMGTFSDTVTKKIVAHAKTASGRSGGYTRVIKLGPRMSDSARMAIIELVK